MWAGGVDAVEPEGTRTSRLVRAYLYLFLKTTWERIGYQRIPLRT